MPMNNVFTGLFIVIYSTVFEIARHIALPFLAAHGLPAEVVYKVNEGRPNIADAVVNGRISLVINTPLGRASFFDDRALRRAVRARVCGVGGRAARHPHQLRLQRQPAGADDLDSG